MSEWAAFERVEGPLGPERGYLEAAMIVSMLANVNRDAKKRRRPYDPKDFMPKFGKPNLPDEEYEIGDMPTLAR